jgi:hypothetical protein
MSTLIFGILNIGYGLFKLAGIVVAGIMSKVKMPGNAGAAPGFASMQSDPTFAAWTKYTMPLGVVLGLALLAFGIGLLLLKNWGRLGSIVWSMIEIVLVLIGTIVMYPVTQRMMAQMPNVPHGMVQGMATIGLVVGLIIGVAYPALVLFFMTRTNVIEACQGELPPPPVGDPV